MNRRFASVAPTIWTSNTGREWRRLGRDYQVLGHYLITNPHANAYGLYYLPMVIVVEETGIDRETCGNALRTFAAQEYAYYDERSEWTWIRNMAARQMGITATPSPREPRVVGVRRWYASCAPNPFLGPFYDHYHDTFGLESKRDGGAWKLAPRVVDGALVNGRAQAAELFERWFTHYPKPSGKKAALDEWLSISPLPDEAFTEKCIEAVERQKRSRGWLKAGGQYIPEPDKWLHKGRWDDVAPDLPNVSEDDADRLATYGDWIGGPGGDD